MEEQCLKRRYNRCLSSLFSRLCLEAIELPVASREAFDKPLAIVPI